MHKDSVALHRDARKARARAIGRLIATLFNRQGFTSGKEARHAASPNLARQG
jgi:hypothetical protein